MEGDKMTDDIIEIDDYEVKDKQIIETDDEENYQGQYGSQKEYDDDSTLSGFYKSISLNNTSLLIIGMVIVLLIVIFLMTFD